VTLAARRASNITPRLAGALTKILVFAKIQLMSWTVTLKESVIDDFAWFGSP
jgi:hypothetical protein